MCYGRHLCPHSCPTNEMNYPKKGGSKSNSLMFDSYSNLTMKNKRETEGKRTKCIKKQRCTCICLRFLCIQMLNKQKLENISKWKIMLFHFLYCARWFLDGGLIRRLCSISSENKASQHLNGWAPMGTRAARNRTHINYSALVITLLFCLIAMCLLRDESEKKKRMTTNTCVG